MAEPVYEDIDLSEYNTDPEPMEATFQRTAAPSRPGRYEQPPLSPAMRSFLDTIPSREVRGRPAPQQAPLPTEVGKPVLVNPDGTVSTERTITIESGGKHHLIPTIVGGKQVAPEQAIREWEAGKNPAVGSYATAQEAETQARARSQRIGQSLQATQVTPEAPPATGGGPFVRGDRRRIESARSLAATLDIPFEQAYLGEAQLSEELKKRNFDFFKTAGKSVLAGFGDLYATAGRAIDLAVPQGSEASRISRDLREYGQRMQHAYQQPVKPGDFTFDKMLDLEWWATTAARGLPITMSLLPATVVGAWGGLGIGTAYGLGLAAKTILATLGGVALSRPIEAGFEAAGTYDEAIQRGMTDDQARAAAGYTFTGNLALSGMDAAQLALAFTPMRLVGSKIPKILQNRILAATARAGGIMTVEGLEEGVQTGIQRWAIGDPLRLFDPEMKESMALGAVYSLGLGGAASVYHGMIDQIESKMTPDVAIEYEAYRQQLLASGSDEVQATVKALDQIAEAPGGKEAIVSAIQELKDLSEGKPVEPMTSEEKQANLDKIPESRPVELQVDPQEFTDDLIDKIGSGETSVEEMFGMEPDIALTKMAEAIPAVAEAEGVLPPHPMDDTRFFLESLGVTPEAVPGITTAVEGIAEVVGVKPEPTAAIPEIAPESQVDPEAIESIVSKMAVTGEGKGVAGFDPRLIKVLGGNLYSGDLGAVAIKEMLQNSVDDMRRLADPSAGRVDVIVDSNAQTITVTDNGLGMLPDVATTELLDIGGSKKFTDVKSGGFGIAKVAIFANADRIHIQTVAAKPDGTKVMTTLTGSGDEWLDPSQGLALETLDVPAKTPTGTVIAVTIKPEARFSEYQVASAMHKFQNLHKLPMQFTFVLNGIERTGDVKGQAEQKAMGVDATLSDPAGNWTVDVYLSDKMGQGAPPIQVLNQGLPQFEHYVDEYYDVPLPAQITLDVHPLTSPDDTGGYPFSPDREKLRTEVKQAVGRYVRTLANQGAQRENKKFKDALDKAPLIPGTQYKVVDSSTVFTPKDLSTLAGRKYQRPLSDIIKTTLQRMAKTLEPFNASYGRVEYTGIGLGNDYLGINISGRGVTGQETVEKEIGGQIALVPPNNLVLMNPYITASEVMQHLSMGHIPAATAEVQLYRQLAITVIHEMSHQAERGHGTDFAGALDRNHGYALDDFNWMVRTLELQFKNKGISLYAELLQDYSDIIQPAYARARDVVNVFGKISTSAAAEVRPGGPGVDTETGEGRGAGLEAPVSAGGVSEAEELAAAPARAEPRQPPVELTAEQKELARFIQRDIQLTAALKQAQQDLRIAVKVGTKAAVDKAKAQFREVLAAAKVKYEHKGFVEGFATAQKVTRWELLQMFRDQQKTVEETRKAMADVIEEELPVAERGKFLHALIKSLTKKQQVKILDRIAATKERLTEKAQGEEIEELQTYNKGIPVEYNRRIQAILGDINTHNFRPSTIAKLKSLQEYADDVGMPAGVSRETLEKLEAISMKQAADMTAAERQTLIDAGNHLTEMGKLKTKMLKYKKAGELQKQVDKTLASTTNLDYESDNKLAKMAQQAYLLTLTPHRVAEMIDGYKRGAHTDLVKFLAYADKDAQIDIATTLEKAVKELSAAGFEVLTPEQEIRITINIRAQEGAPYAVMNLMKKHGFLTEQEIQLVEDLKKSTSIPVSEMLGMFTLPPLQGNEQQLIDILKKYSGERTDEIAALWEETKNTPFVKLPNRVIPLRYVGSARPSPEEAIHHAPRRGTQTEQGFAEERLKNVNLEPRIDVMNMFAEGINDQLWYLHMQPVLDNTAQIVSNKAVMKAMGKQATQWWADHLDIVSSRGWSAKAHHDDVGFGLKTIRGNLSQAVLGYKISSILMQPFAVFDAIAYAHSQYGARATQEIIQEFAKSWIIPGYAKAYAEGSTAIQLRKGGELAIEEMMAKMSTEKQGLWNGFVRHGLSALLWADVKTAAGAQSAFEKILERHGVPNAKQEAGILMELTASSSDVTFRPHVLARGEGARTAFTFMTFALNRWGLVAHDLAMKGIVKGDLKHKISASVGLMMIIAATMAEDEARGFIYEFVTKRKLPERSLMERVTMALPSNIPYFGAIYETSRGRPSEIPVVRVLTDILRAWTIPFQEKTETQLRIASRAIEGGISALLGIPMTSQTFDVIERMLFPDKEPKNKNKPKKAVTPKKAGNE